MKYLIAFYLTLTISAAVYTLQERTFQATIIQVVDGDTVIVHVDGFPLPFEHMNVRLDGIDTPESRRNDAKCEKELRLGLIAKAWLKEKLPPGTKVKVIWSGESEKFGRLLAAIILDGENINRSLVRLGHAVEYHGATKNSWCHK